MESYNVICLKTKNHIFKIILHYMLHTFVEPSLSFRSPSNNRFLLWLSVQPGIGEVRSRRQWADTNLSRSSSRVSWQYQNSIWSYNFLNYKRKTDTNEINFKHNKSLPLGHTTLFERLLFSISHFLDADEAVH